MQALIAQFGQNGTLYSIIDWNIEIYILRYYTDFKINNYDYNVSKRSNFSSYSSKIKCRIRYLYTLNLS